MAGTSTTPDIAAGIPLLSFAVSRAEGLYPAAVPTLRVTVDIEAPDGVVVRSIMLAVQVQIAAPKRRYTPEEQSRLLELFGTPERWGTTLRTLLWTRATVLVPPFTGQTVAELNVPCSYDLEVAGARYLAALEEGEVPLELLFSGTVFFSDSNGTLQAARIPWEHEVELRLPVAVWREAIDRHFPGAAWLRLGRDSFDRLSAYKARHAFRSWDDAIEALLDD